MNCRPTVEALEPRDCPVGFTRQWRLAFALADQEQTALQAWKHPDPPLVHQATILDALTAETGRLVGQAQVWRDLDARAHLLLQSLPASGVPVSLRLWVNYVSREAGAIYREVSQALDDLYAGLDDLQQGADPGQLAADLYDTWEGRAEDVWPDVAQTRDNWVLKRQQFRAGQVSKALKEEAELNFWSTVSGYDWQEYAARTWLSLLPVVQGD